MDEGNDAGANGKARALFVCTHDSARSQIAEGMLRHLAGDRFEAFSAGTEATHVRPQAIEAMAEVGIDISEQYPKALKTYLGKQFFNYLVILCARAEEQCPKTFPEVGTRFSWVFDDPRRDEDLPYDSTLERFREIRDEIELKIRDWLDDPEQELRKLEEERERRGRLEAARREAKIRDAFASMEAGEDDGATLTGAREQEATPVGPTGLLVLAEPGLGGARRLAPARRCA